MLVKIALSASLFVASAAISTGSAAQTPTGSYGAVMEYDPGSAPARTVYRPRDLAKAKRLPIVAWGNGGCKADGGAGARPFLLELASQGFLIMAPAKPGPDRVPAEQLPPTSAPTAPPPGPDATDASELTKSIDWAIAESRRPGSIYFGKLDTTAVAVMGHSCGGLQALAASADPRVKTTMIWNSGVYNRPGGRSGVRIGKDDLKALHAPVIYVLGGPTDIAYENGSDDFARINHVPAVLMESPVGHGGTFQKPNGGDYAKIAKAWLNWRLRHDIQAGQAFARADCGYCRDAAWKITRKQMD